MTRANNLGKLLRSQSFHSKILNDDLNYSIYLPYDYKEEVSYPITYLFHPGSGNENSWFENGKLKEYLDDAIANNHLPPMIFVTPCGTSQARKGERSLFLNHQKNYNYGDMFIEELIPKLENNYSVDSSKRFIGGCAAGGLGALFHGFNRPDLFKGILTVSAAILSKDLIENMADTFYDNFFSMYLGKDLKGSDRINGVYHDLDIITNIRKDQYKNIDQLCLYADCGDRDMKGMVTITNALFHVELSRKGIPHDYRVREGEHNWDYWSSSIPGFIEFLKKNIT